MVCSYGNQNLAAMYVNSIMFVGDCITLLLPEQVEVPADMCACNDMHESTLCPSGELAQSHSQWAYWTARVYLW